MLFTKFPPILYATMNEIIHVNSDKDSSEKPLQKEKNADSLFSEITFYYVLISILFIFASFKLPISVNIRPRL